MHLSVRAPTVNGALCLERTNNRIEALCNLVPNKSKQRVHIDREDEFLSDYHMFGHNEENWFASTFSRGGGRGGGGGGGGGGGEEEEEEEEEEEQEQEQEQEQEEQEQEQEEEEEQEQEKQEEEQEQEQ